MTITTGDFEKMRTRVFSAGRSTGHNWSFLSWVSRATLVGAWSSTCSSRLCPKGYDRCASDDDQASPLPLADAYRQKRVSSQKGVSLGRRLFLRTFGIAMHSAESRDTLALPQCQNGAGVG